MLLDNAIVIASEAALSLYPILIKTVPTTLVTQLLSRFATFTVLGFALAGQAWPAAFTTRSLIFGTVTLIHVAVSYFAFSTLPAGVAMSLFYTYPILNILAGIALFGDSIGLKQATLVLVAALGTLLVSLNSQESEEKKIDWRGVAAAIAAAATETIMYFAVRTRKGGNAFKSVLEMYPGALLGLILATGLRGVEWKPDVWGPMTLFNIVIGFLGYALRFYVIPNVETSVFSILSFVGVAAAFGWGWLFVKEVPRAGALAGALLITLASAAV